MRDSAEILAALNVLDDATAARLDGLLPGHIAVLVEDTDTDGPAQAQAVIERVASYLAAAGLTGYARTRLARVGVADHCPSWCDTPHDIVALIDVEAGHGRDHAGPQTVIPTEHGTAIASLHTTTDVLGTVVSLDLSDGWGRLAPRGARDLAMVLLRLADEAEADVE